MSAGSSGISLPLTVDDTAVDSAFARLLQKYQALRSELQKPINLSTTQASGSAVFGMAPAARLASGVTGPSEFRLLGGAVGGGTGLGTSSFAGGSASPVASISPTAPWRGMVVSPSPIPITGTPMPSLVGGGQQAMMPGALGVATLQNQIAAMRQQVAAMPGGQAVAAGLVAAGIAATPPATPPTPAQRSRLVSDSPEFFLGRSWNTWAAGAFAGHAAISAIGDIQDRHKREFLAGFMPAEDRTQMLMQQASNEMGGFGGATRRFLNSFPAITGIPWLLKKAGVDFDAEGKFEAAYAADLSLRQVKINTLQRYEKASEGIRIERQQSLLPNIREYDANVTGNRLARADAVSRQADLDNEGKLLRQQLADAKSTNDKRAEQEVKSKLRVYDASYEAKKELIQDTKSQTMSRTARDEYYDRFQTTLSLDGRKRELRDIIAHPRNPRFAEIDSMLTRGEQEITEFTRINRPEFAEKARGNLLLEIAASKRRYETSFKGGSIGWGEIGHLLSENTAESPQAMFDKFAKAKREAENFDPRTDGQFPALKLDEETMGKLQKIIEQALANQISN